MKKVVLENYREVFTPSLVRSSNWIECLLLIARSVIDTQFRSIYSSLKPLVRNLNGRVLDVGAGSQFYRRLIGPNAEYTALEVGFTRETFRRSDGIADLYDGRSMPYEDRTFDAVLAIEVLEHAVSTEALLQEIQRVLKPGGRLFLTVPFAARYHFAPHDYWRFTPSGLVEVFARHAPRIRIEIHRRGADFTVAFHGVTIALLSCLYRRNPFAKLIGVALLPVALLSGFLANVSEYLDIGSPDNTLGYTVLGHVADEDRLATKPESARER